MYCLQQEHWWLDYGSRLDYDIEAVMVADIRSWPGDNSRHFTGLSPWLVHIGREIVGTLVKLRFSQEQYVQCIITRPDNLDNNTLCVTSNAFLYGFRQYYLCFITNTDNVK